MSAFTESQHQALCRAYDLLGEHFDGVLISVVSENVELKCGHHQDVTKVAYSGGHMRARGLASEAADFLASVRTTDATPQ